MPPADRRDFLKPMGSGAFAAAMQQSIGPALAIRADNRAETIDDVAHVVVLMQENRSFDHHFGTPQGVRGFADLCAVTLPSGCPVWYRPVGATFVLPFHPTAPNLGLRFIKDLAHDRETTHLAWNEGRWDQWVPQKGTTTMAHLDRVKPWPS